MTAALPVLMAYSLAGETLREIILSVIITPIAIFGGYAFIINRLYEYMFLQTQFVFFDFSKPLILTLCEYQSIIVMFAWIGYWLKRILVKRR